MIIRKMTVLAGLPWLALLPGCGMQEALDQQKADFRKEIEVQAQADLSNIQGQVADDAVEQYRMVSLSGTAIDQCVQAGMVSASFLQKKDQAEYQKWKSIERNDCSRAGLPN